MGMNTTIQRLALDNIVVKREDRQRRAIGQASLLELVASIKKYGLLNPIVVEKETKELIAGERRLSAYKYLRDGWKGEGKNPWTAIPFSYISDLSVLDAQIVELEENLRREELSWQDECLAVEKIYRLMGSPTQAEAAASLGMSPGNLSEILAVAGGLLRGDKLVVEACGRRAAYNAVGRAQDRALDTMVADLMGGGPAQPDLFAPPTPPPSPTVASQRGCTAAPQAAPQTPLAPAFAAAKEGPRATSSSPIINEDFLYWAEHYRGPKFNFIHCDFPYGINLDKASANAAPGDRRLYEDSPETYQKLLHGFGRYMHNFVSPSAHLMFWFSMTTYETTVRLLGNCGFEVQPFPLIWARNRGILPRPEYGPRQIYETALICTLGRRKVAQSVPNLFAYEGSEGKGDHPSWKPSPMLEHFFRMFVDGETRLLDPTCGSGSSLRVAKRLGASAVLGLEIDQEAAKTAQTLWTLGKE